MNTEFKITNSHKGLEDLRRNLEEIASSWGLGKKQLFEINLILEELCANNIEHTAGQGGSYLIIRLSSDGSTCSITVTDNGPPFNPEDIPSPDVTLPLEQRRAGGLGLLLVRHYTDSMTYTRSNDENIIHMEKTLV